MEIPPWNWLWTQEYRAYFAMPHELVRYAAGLQPENTTPFSLPDSQPMRLRKLARVGVLGSAALLMQSGEFKSFKAADVLPPLQQRFPQWADFLEETRVLAVCLAVATDERLSAYTANLVAWFDWVQQHTSA